MMKNDFVNLDHTLEGLMPGRSLPAFLTVQFGKRLLGSNQFSSRYA